MKLLKNRTVLGVLCIAAVSYTHLTNKEGTVQQMVSALPALSQKNDRLLSEGRGGHFFLLLKMVQLISKVM